MNFLSAAFWTDMISGTFMIGLGVILVLGWNFEFLSKLKSVLWRISTVYNSVFCVVAVVLFGTNKHSTWF